MEFSIAKIQFFPTASLFIHSLRAENKFLVIETAVAILAHIAQMIEDSNIDTSPILMKANDYLLIVTHHTNEETMIAYCSRSKNHRNECTHSFKYIAKHNMNIKMSISWLIIITIQLQDLKLLSLKSKRYKHAYLW